MKKIATVMAAAALAAFLSPSAKATPIKGHGPGSIQNGCNGSGDLYFPPGAHGVYGCLKANGSGVVCGGVGGYSKTCSVFASDGKRKKLPSQDEVSTQTTQATQATQASKAAHAK